MYNFFCCCFFPELQTKTTPPITVQTIAKNISLNIIPAQDSQDRTIRTEDIVVTPPGLIDEIFDDVKEESKEESKETSKRNSFYVSPPATPPSSPAMLKRAMPVSIIQVEKMHDFLLQQVTQSVTILLHANSQMKCNFILRESLSNKILKVI